MKTPELEYMVAQHFGVGKNLIIPNVSWGFGLEYEADLVVVTRSRYVYEVELKVSKADLKADMKKRACAHKGKEFKRFYYAMPENIYDPDLIKIDGAGILLACESSRGIPYIREAVKPANRSKVMPVSEARYTKLLELCAMRMWTMKRNELKRIKEKEK